MCCRLSFIVIVVGLGVGSAHAQITAGSGYNVKDAAKKHKELTKVWTHTVDHGWVSSVDLALNAASGNSDTGYFTAGLTLDKKRGKNEYVAKISYAYGEESGEKSLDELLALASWKRVGSGGYYTGARLDMRQDSLADLDYRLGATFLQGYNLYKSKKGWVTPEIGVGFTLQELGDSETERLNAYVGLHAEYWLHAKTRFYMSSTLFVPFKESSAAYFWGELGIETLLTERMSLKLYLQDSYENSPAAGKEHNDLRIIAGLSFKL